MKTAYAPDNTRSSIVIVLALALAVALVAALIGLSEKPDLQSIALSVGSTEPAPVVESAENFGFDVGPDAPPLEDQSAAQQVDTDTSSESSGDDSDPSFASGDDTDQAADAEAIVVPTSEPSPTAEVAAAVEPTPIPDQTGQTADNSTAVQAAPSLPSTSGSVQGTFFTKGDENEGAVVSQNLITLSFAEDGSGAFQGVLDITYADGTHILLNMSGPLTWAPTNPQVEATLTGAFTLDAPIDADDIFAEDAELSISSLEAGSGSLCRSTTKCFGFTFPPQ